MQKMNKKKILAIVRDTKDLKQEANDWIDALVDLSQCAIFKRFKKPEWIIKLLNNDPYMSEELRVLKYHLTDLEHFQTVGQEIEELMDCINKLRNGYPLPSLMKSATDCKSIVTGNEKENSIYDFTKKKLDK
jgi:hypothetical protein